jgi:hypothetical protein
LLSGNKAIRVVDLILSEFLSFENIILKTEVNYQGLAVEKSSVQRLNQGVCTDVLNIIRA